MANYKTPVIVLRTYDFNDDDKIVVLYSKDRGLIRAVAKGVKKPKSKLGSRIEPLLALDMLMYEGRNLDVINQCDISDSFKHLRNNLTKLTFGLYYAELTSAFAIEHDPASESIYNFLFESLKKLEASSEDSKPELLLLQYQHKMLGFAGYTPMFNYCVSCNMLKTSFDKVYFNSQMGTIVCYNCAGRNSNLIGLDVNTYKLLLELKDDYEISPDTTSAVALKAVSILNNFISLKTNYTLKTPKLIETLCLS